jgi:acyl carrier protein
LHPCKPKKLIISVAHKTDSFLCVLKHLNQFIQEDIAAMVETDETIKSLFNNETYSSSTTIFQKDTYVTLKKIWKGVLNKKEIHIADSFFDLGGDSLLYIKLFNHIKKLGYNIKMSDLLTCHSLGEQVFLLNKSI